MESERTGARYGLDRGRGGNKTRRTGTGWKERRGEDGPEALPEATRHSQSRARGVACERRGWRRSFGVGG